MIGAPPSLVGAVKFTEIAPSLAVALTIVGIPGTLAEGVGDGEVLVVPPPAPPPQALSEANRLSIAARTSLFIVVRPSIDHGSV